MNGMLDANIHMHKRLAKKTDNDLSAACGIHRTTFAKRIKTGDLTVRDLLIISNLLKTTPNKLLEGVKL